MDKRGPAACCLSGRDGRMGTENQLGTFLIRRTAQLTRGSWAGRSRDVSIFCSLSETPVRPSRLGFRVYVRYPTDTRFARSRTSECKKASMNANSKIAAIDSEIGALIRKRRVASGLTLQALAVALGCTPQQLSKYEKGEDRVSARLLQIAETLQKPVGSFYPEKRFR